jgi:RHH-type proline utilization regulon transcriptional repressor/proline dehydrogenase/delta 1-pyrroline-5-carboxylate dehydrogenase
LRVLGTRAEALNRLNAEQGIHIADAPVLSLGRFELLHYLYEQSLSIEYHRYGNLGVHGLAAAKRT